MQQLIQEGAPRRLEPERLLPGTPRLGTLFIRSLLFLLLTCTHPREIIILLESTLDTRGTKKKQREALRVKLISLIFTAGS